MEINDFGNGLIDKDLKRLKKHISLEEDLQNYYTAHVNRLRSFGALSCQIAATKDYIVCKERVAVSSSGLSPSKGCRLWFVITKTGYYIRCLLYLASEEKHYKKSICFKTVRERLETILIK